MGKSHLILGTTTDFITGQTVADTHDEQIRQKLAKLLVEEKGYAKTDITTRVPLSVTVDNDTGVVTLDFVIALEGRAVMIVQFGPGDIVSRQRPLLAAARLLAPHVIPFAVISNGEDTHVMDVATGRVIGEGLDAIFSRDTLKEKTEALPLLSLPDKKREGEQRILFCMEVLTERECATYVCKGC
ncbi:MAG: type I restriction enzyme HsdR N-terminal domain-containing protein [Thermodesulfobacteriota bacterium]|nr:type I restriction enzyme HsdR N-terminal domain-containing protein [Thermodesulfobacteriota bacterium]